MKAPNQKIIELSTDQVQGLLDRAETGLNEQDYETLKAVFESYVYLTGLVEDKRTTIDRLRKLLFGSPTEKTREVIPPEAQPPAVAEGSAGPPPQAAPEAEPAKPPPGHGRNGADDYEGAERIEVPHASLKSGDPCPDCRQGTVYEVAQPGVLVRLVGQAPVQAKVYELQKLRCNLCGKVFTAVPPEGVGEEKYDATAASMIALLKYGSGLPFNRLEGLQGNLGIPLPASTQWDIVRDAAEQLVPVYAELIRQAAQGEVVFNDDTTVKILEFMGKRARQAALAEDGVEAPAKKNGAERRGMFTSGIVSSSEGRRIALFFSGRRHAGENLADVLAQRTADLAPPIQMCDALSRNLPANLKTILANCLAHGRRQFVDVAERFPAECRYVLETLADVYKNDALAREQNLPPEARRHFHQAESGPLMEKLQEWCLRQFEEQLVEPNSALGEAISYLLKHWEKLTLFLRQPGAPLDNNICERALKMAILHRKNALFYRSLNGAHVGDVFMSLIYTCQFCGADPFDYLTETQRHAEQLRLNPEKWMPWNYRETLAGGATSPDTPR
jgi:transposase